MSRAATADMGRWTSHLQPAGGPARPEASGAGSVETQPWSGLIPIRSADIPADGERAFELARRYDNWPVHGMVYVALAERLRTEFCTAGDRLRARLSHLPWVRGLEGQAGRALARKSAGAPGAAAAGDRLA